MGFLTGDVRGSYFVALAAVAGLTLASQWVIQSALASASGDASAINIAGRQRMLSQKLTKAAWVRLATEEAETSAAALAEFENSLLEFVNAHEFLADVVKGDPESQAQYQGVDPLHGNLVLAANALLDKPGARVALEQLAQAEAVFLPEMNTLVGALERAADKRVQQLRQVESILMWVTLVVLLLESLFIFEPLRRSLRERVSDLVKAKEIAERSSRVQDEFLSAMSHEIRTPLNGVIGMSELLMDSELSPQQRELAATCNRSSVVLLSLVNDILDYAKVKSSEVQLETRPFLPEQVIAEVAQLIAPQLAERPVELIVEGPEDFNLEVHSDPLRVRQVLINLASNAAKFTLSGQVQLRWLISDQGASEQTLIFEVEDSGVGIPSDRREAIFERFTQADSSTTRSFGGTGLGLALSREWADRMGARILLQSEVDRGSLFRFEVPLAAQAQRRPQAKAHLARGRRLAVLIQHPEQCAAHARIVRQLGGAPLEFHSFAELAELGEEQLSAMDVVLVEREALEEGGAARPLPKGLRAEAIILLGRFGDPLEASSERAAGTAHPATFTLYRPLQLHALVECFEALWTSDDAKDKAPTGPGTTKPFAGLKVLAVEDNPVNRRLLEAHLKHLGCQSVFANDGLEALQRAAEETFELVLMDCQMPNMDGYTASSEIRKLDGGSELVIIALSANTLPEHFERCKTALMDDCLSKPYSRQGLREAIQTWVPRFVGRAEA